MEAIIRNLRGYTGFLFGVFGLLIVGFLFYIDAQKSTRDGAPRVEAPPAKRALDTPKVKPPSLPAVAPPAVPAPQGGLPSPQVQGAAHKPYVEGHWHGLELLELTPELARVYQLGPSQTGLLVDEVSLDAAECGLMAGDVVFRLGGMSVATLQDVSDVTYQLRTQTRVQIDVLRNGQPFAFVLQTQRELGFAMFEAASPILPGAISPHKKRGRACADCHIFMASGGQLPTDAGDLVTTPPPIAADARPPHGARGPCNVCHRVIGAALSPSLDALQAPATVLTQ